MKLGRRVREVACGGSLLVAGSLAAQGERFGRGLVGDLWFAFVGLIGLVAACMTFAGTVGLTRFVLTVIATLFTGIAIVAGRAHWLLDGIPQSDVLALMALLLALVVGPPPKAARACAWCGKRVPTAELKTVEGKGLVCAKCFQVLTG